MRRITLAAGAAMLLGAGTLVAGCGEDERANGMGSAATQQQQSSKQSATETGASELRAGLTALLQEHVYLAGTAIATGVDAGLDSKQFESAAGTLDKNSKGLAKAIGSVYGPAAGDQFLALWRDHIGFFVDYTKAKAGKDAKGAQAAKDGLDDYRAEFGAFIASANPNLSKEAVASELKPHVNSVFRVIDSVVAGSPQVYDKLRAAAAHMPGTANVLAGAIAKQKPEAFPAQ